MYCDEEIIGRHGDVLDVKIKPDFFVEAFEGCDGIGAALFIRRSFVEQAGGLDLEFDGVQLFDLVLRASKYTDRIVHLKKVLYQTRQCEPPTQDEFDRSSSLCKRARERRMTKGAQIVVG